MFDRDDLPEELKADINRPGLRVAIMLGAEIMRDEKIESLGGREAMEWFVMLLHALHGGVDA